MRPKSCSFCEQPTLAAGCPSGRLQPAPGVRPFPDGCAAWVGHASACPSERSSDLAGFQPAPTGAMTRTWLKKPPGKAAAGKIACPTVKDILVVLPATDHYRSEHELNGPARDGKRPRERRSPGRTSKQDWMPTQIGSRAPRPGRPISPDRATEYAVAAQDVSFRLRPSRQATWLRTDHRPSRLRPSRLRRSYRLSRLRPSLRPLRLRTSGPPSRRTPAPPG
jgi:hypothetical protein